MKPENIVQNLYDTYFGCGFTKETIECMVYDIVESFEEFTQEENRNEIWDHMYEEYVATVTEDSLAYKDIVGGFNAKPSE